MGTDFSTATKAPYAEELIPAGADLSSLQHRFVKLSSGTIVQATAGEGFGAVQNAPASGKYGRVRIAGYAHVTAAAAIAAYVSCKSDANGKAVACTSGDESLGYFVQAPGADGDVCLFFLERHTAV